MSNDVSVVVALELTQAWLDDARSSGERIDTSVRAMAPHRSRDASAVKRSLRDGLLRIGQKLSHRDEDGWLICERYVGTSWDGELLAYVTYVRREPDREIAYYRGQVDELLGLGREVPEWLTDRIEWLRARS